MITKLMETFTLTYKNSFWINDSERITEEHTETYGSYEEAEGHAWHCYYADMGSTIWDIRINGESFADKHELLPI
jgi:hypothetical protein